MKICDLHARREHRGAPGAAAAIVAEDAGRVHRDGADGDGPAAGGEDAGALERAGARDFAFFS